MDIETELGMSADGPIVEEGGTAETAVDDGVEGAAFGMEETAELDR